MSLVNDLLPTNLLEEKQKFFADQSVNPIFSYARTFTESELLRYGVTEPDSLDLAQNILDKAYFNKTENELFAQEGKNLDQDEVTHRTRAYLQTYALDKQVAIEWSMFTAVRTSIGEARIRFRLPCDFREEGFLGMLAHEIGTHALRNVNYMHQPWFRKKKTFGFSNHLTTEEGLAVLNAQIPHSNKLLYIGSLRYLAVWYAQKGSFLDVWHGLAPYVDNLERRWIICTRVKRGLEDTSMSGGFTKDMLYLLGPLKVHKWLQNNNYNITPLYFGKVAMEDADKAMKLNPTYQPLLPDFYRNNPQKYAEDIATIAAANDF